MVSIGDGLRMMQGGVDRTGYADMADAIGNPGLDLIKQRRAQAEQEAKLQALLDSMMLGDDGSGDLTDMSGLPKSGLSAIDEDMGKFTPSFDVEPTFTQKIVEGGKNAFQKGLEALQKNPIQSALTVGSFLNLPLAAIMGGYYLGKENPIPTPEDAVEYGNFEKGNLGVAMDKSGFFDKGSIQRQRELNDALADPYADLPSWYDEMDHEGSMAGVYDTREFAYGGRVHLQGGGMDAGAGSLSGDKGFGAGVSKGVQDRMNRGGNKQGKINIPDKEVDIDQLKGDPLSMPSVSNYMGITNIDPKMMYSIGPTMQMQPPVDETSAFDQFSKYNLLDKTFDLGSGFTFGYDIDPSLKNLGDLSAEANLTYSFNQGGNVSGKVSDDEKTLRLSDEDKFIQAQTVGDTELYNYLIGGEITPGLNFELGLMDDAIMEPGMTSPDDYKFFRLIKEF